MQLFYVTISSIFTTIILDSIIALILIRLFRNCKVAVKMGPNYMLALLLMVVIRTFFPLEFWYTKAVFIEDILSDIRRILEYSICRIDIFEFKIKHCLLLVWILGIIVTLMFMFFSYRKQKRIILMSPKKSGNEFASQYQLELQDYKGIENVKIVSSNKIESPYVFGFNTKYIVLPSIPFDRQQLHYILLHELMHVRKKDIVWKTLIGILCIVFWWNPVF